jgi:coproporphyrinogen III oxidase
VIEAIDVITVRTVKEYLHHLQNRICAMVEMEDGSATFLEEPWQHKEGGGGLTRSLAGGKIIEKAGVNFSHVKGIQLPPAATKKRPELVDSQFQAMGVSTVIHPRNPFIPTSHLNVRFIIAERQNALLWL